MKTRCFAVSLLMFSAIAVCLGQAQTEPAKPTLKQAQVKTAKPPVDAAALTAVREHLHNALEAIKSALPIYGGPRGKSITAARRALSSVEHALNDDKQPVKEKSPAKDAKNTNPAPVKSKAEQIADSQAAMTKGQTELEAAAKALESETKWNQTEAGAAAVKQIQTAIEEAKASIAVFAKAK